MGLANLYDPQRGAGERERDLYQLCRHVIKRSIINTCGLLAPTNALSCHQLIFLGLILVQQTSCLP